MKKILVKTAELFKEIYTAFCPIDKESFAPIAAIMASLIYFVVILVFRPWNYALLGEDGVQNSFRVADIVAKVMLLTGSAVAVVVIILSRIGKLKSSFLLISMFSYMIGFTLSFTIKMREYGNFYLNIEMLYLALFLVSALLFMFSGYGAVSKRKSMIYQYGIAAVVLFAAFVKPIVTGDGSELVSSFRDLVPQALVFLYFALITHGMQDAPVRDNENTEKAEV